MDKFCGQCGTFRDTEEIHCPRCSTTLTIHNPPAPSPAVVPQQAPAVRGDYAKPIVSDAMGFVADPADVAEHRKRCPDVELVIQDGCARPKFQSLSQKRRYMQQMNWADTKDYR